MAAALTGAKQMGKVNTTNSVRINVKPSKDRHDSHNENNAELREPFVYVKWITNRPRLTFVIALGVHLLFVALTGILVVSGYDLFPTNFKTLPLELHDEPWLKRDYAWRDRDEYSNRVDRTLPSFKTSGLNRTDTREAMILFYNAGSGGNIFTQSKLNEIKRIEDQMVSVPDFPQYCQLTVTGACHPPVSVLRFFDGTYAAVDAVFNDTGFDNIDAVLFAAYTYNETKAAFVFTLGRDSVVTRSHVRSAMTRTMIALGWPIPGYSTDNDMTSALTDFMVAKMKPLLDGFLGESQFEFLYYNSPMMFHDMNQQAMYDMALAVGSLIFIFCFIWFHTRSLFVTSMAELSIVCSFVETNLIYRIVIGFKYFGYFHVLAMFIILGIGADDLFVFWDAWVATGLRKSPSLAHRLNEAYRKSVISMLVTSVTTMAAFLSNALSPLLATRSFGVFSAILVGINYLSVITFFPAIIIFYHVYFEDKPHPCCCCWGSCSKQKVTNEEDSVYTLSLASAKTNGHTPTVHTISSLAKTSDKAPDKRKKSSSQEYRICSWRSSHGKAHSQTNGVRKPGHVHPHQDDEVQEVTDVTAKPNKLVIFFRDYYFAFVTHKVVRWVIVTVLLACLAGFTYSATHLEPDNEQVQVYADSHHYSKAIRYNNYGFMANDLDRTVTIYLVWGLKETDLSECHFSSIECRGSSSLDDSFDASTIAAQQSFVNLCDTLYSFTDQQVSDYAIKRNLVSGHLEIACFPRNLEAFLKTKPVSGTVQVNMPWDWTRTSRFMTSLSKYYDTSAFNSNFTRYLDIPMTYWIWDGFRQNNTADYQMFNDLFGEQKDTFSSNVRTSSSMTTGNRIRYLAIAVNTTLKLESLGYTEGIPIVERWEKFMESQMSSMPPEMKGGFQSTYMIWHWLYVQRSLAQNAILGIAIGVSVAFPVLVISTCNIFNGLMATLSICCVTICVIGVVPLGGWKLGVLVSLNMCLVVGLAVDFVVHLAEGYHLSHAKDRKTRLQQALERMGISVFSGACTTLGASAFMIFAKIQFFVQFGIFMFCTIGFSLIFSMGLYVTVMGIMGPQDRVGDIRVLFTKCRKRGTRPKENGNVHPAIELQQASNGSSLTPHDNSAYVGERL